MSNYSQYPILWYAQSSSAFYSAKKIEDFSSRIASIAKKDEEFKSDEYLTLKNTGPKGIHRYGVSNDIKAEDNFVDFFFEDNVDDFHYSTFSQSLLYGLTLTFKYDKNQWKSFGHFAKCLTFTKNQKKSSDIKLTDIFVYKFGHADISARDQTQTFTHDGYSIGFKASLIIDETKTVNICIRANLPFSDLKPTFHVIVSPNFDCTCYIEVHTDDLEYRNVQVSENLQKDSQKLIYIDSTKKKQESIEQDQIKKDYQEIARFVDWSDAPTSWQIDWGKDDIDLIRKKLLGWASLMQFKSRFMIQTKYFCCDNQGVILYKNKKYYEYLVIPIFIKDLNNDNTAIYNLAHNSTYQISQENIIHITGTINDIQYELILLGTNSTLPTINLKLITHSKVTLSIDISSQLPFNFKRNTPKWITLENETLEFTTTD